MKSISIKFFTLSDNTIPKAEKPAKKVGLTGSISAKGKLLLPFFSLDLLGLPVEETIPVFIGAADGKRKVTKLYLLPAPKEEADTFLLHRGKKSYSVGLGLLLKGKGVDFDKQKISFSIDPYTFEEGIQGLELTLSQTEKAEKAPYTGKPRGRKPKTTSNPV